MLYREDKEEENEKGLADKIADALVAKGGLRLKKKRPNPKKAAPKKNPKKDLSKIQCFKCQEWGHFASHCPLNKQGQAAEEEDDDDMDVGMAEHFDLCAMIADGRSGNDQQT